MKRRQSLQISASLALFPLTGCIASSSEDEPSNSSRSTETVDEQSTEDWPPGGFAVDFKDTTQPSGCLNLEISSLDAVSHSQPEYSDVVQPARVDIQLTNTCEETKTIEFSGFVPIAQPVATTPERNYPEVYADQMIVLPAEEPDGPPQDCEIPEYEQIGDYFLFREPFEPPTETSRVTLQPGESIGGHHFVIAGYQDTANRAEDFRIPEPDDYRFRSPLEIVNADGTHETKRLEFTVTVDTAAAW